MGYDTKGGAAGTIGRQSLQGATFGFADEIIDAIGVEGAKAYAKEFAPELLNEITWKEARQLSKPDLARDWENAPVTSFASQAAGSIPMGLTKGGAKLANWAIQGGAKKSLAKGAVLGAGYGNLSGLGSGDDTVVDRALSGASGLVQGAALGAALTPVARWLAAQKKPSQAEITKKSLKSLDLAGTKDQKKAQKYVAAMLAKRPDIQEQLARAKALDAASKSTGINLTLPEKLAQSGSERMLAEQAKIGANPQTAGMMENFYASRSGTPNTSGQIENALLQKVREMSPEAQSYDDVALALINRASQKAKEVTGSLVNESNPLYEQAFKKSLPAEVKTTYKTVGDLPVESAKTGVVSEELLKLMDADPVAAEFINRAVNTKDPSLLAQVSGKDINSIAVLDAAKKLIDQSLKSYGADAPANPAALNKARSLIVSTADKFAPEYGQARAIYSGQPDKLLMRQQIGNLADIDPMEAKQVANTLFSGTQQNAKITAQALGEEGSKQAAAARVLNVMDTARGEPQTWAKKIAPDQRTREMLDIYAGEGQFDDVLNVMKQSAIGDRYRYGSVTEPLKDANEALETAANAGIDLVTGNKLGLIRKAAKMFGITSPEDNPAFYQEMAELITTPKGMALLEQVAQGNQDAAKALLSGSLIKRGASAAGNANPLSRATVSMVNAPQVMQDQTPRQPAYDPYSDPELMQIMQGGQGSYDPYKDPELMEILRSK